jgi:hypothetical protein
MIMPRPEPKTNQCQGTQMAVVIQLSVSLKALERINGIVAPRAIDLASEITFVR